MGAAKTFDVIIVGGGPAGSVAAWSLAKAGAKVAVVERAVFPREKVCGDYVEPGGLRILDAMGRLEPLSAGGRLPITHNRIYFGPRLAYRGPIPYYGDLPEAPPHGLIIPRHELDTDLLETAERASATVFQDCSVQGLERAQGRSRVRVERGDQAFELSAPLVIGADGTASIVARSVGAPRPARRHIGLSQRGYVEGVEIEGGEATIWIDDDIWPGYGWMFPMAGGRANVGVGFFSDVGQKFGLSAPKSFAAAIDRLRLRHEGCAKTRLASRPMGGVIHNYAAAGPNHFDGTLLIGDAGCFVDPMTGEGITQGMESAILAADTARAALERGRFDRTFLGRFERDFRAYFDPGMLLLSCIATVLRNRHLSEFWLRSTYRGCQTAQASETFAHLAGATFGGPDLQPRGALGQLWAACLAYGLDGGMRALADLSAGRPPRRDGLMGDLAALERGWRASLEEDAAGHFAWMAEVARATLALRIPLTARENPRLAGPFAYIAAKKAGALELEHA